MDNVALKGLGLWSLSLSLSFSLLPAWRDPGIGRFGRFGDLCLVCPPFQGKKLLSVLAFRKRLFNFLSVVVAVA